jgi:hypothetical protein
MEDRYHTEHTYKYRGVGEIITDRNIINEWLEAKLWIPDNFPSNSSTDPNKGQWYPNSSYPGTLTSPVSWVVFSLGPKFSQDWLNEKLGADNSNRYPVPKELWYTPEQDRGFIVRMRLKNGTEIGSFEGKQ